MQTTLFESLSVAREKAGFCYDWKPESMRHCRPWLDHRSVLISPGVRIFRAGTNSGYTFLHPHAIVPITVCNLAMFNQNSRVKDSPVDAPTDPKVWREEVKIKFMCAFQSLVSEGVENVVIPDVGCGVFENDANEMGKVLSETLRRTVGWFKSVHISGRRKFTDSINLNLGMALEKIPGYSLRLKKVQAAILDLPRMFQSCVAGFDVSFNDVKAEVVDKLTADQFTLAVGISLGFLIQSGAALPNAATPKHIREAIEEAEAADRGLVLDDVCLAVYSILHDMAVQFLPANRTLTQSWAINMHLDRANLTAANIEGECRAFAVVNMIDDRFSYKFTPIDERRETSKHIATSDTDYDNGTEPVFNQTFQFVVGNQRVIEIIVMNETDEGNVRIGVARFYLASLLNLDFRLAVHLVEPDCGIFSDASHFKGNMAMSLNWKSLNFS